MPKANFLVKVILMAAVRGRLKAQGTGHKEKTIKENLSSPYALRLAPYALRLTPYALRLAPYL
jgi:hypothetical protein